DERAGDVGDHRPQRRERAGPRVGANPARHIIAQASPDSASDHEQQHFVPRQVVEPALPMAVVHQQNSSPVKCLSMAAYEPFVWCRSRIMWTGATVTTRPSPIISARSLSKGSIRSATSTISMWIGRFSLSSMSRGVWSLWW